MQEHGNDEAVPLIGFVGAVLPIFGILLALIGDATQTAEFIERTGEAAGVEGGGIWAGPGLDVGFDDFLDVVHAGREARSHIDEDIRRGTDHDIEVGLGLDGRACEDAVLDELADENTDLYNGQEVTNPRYASTEPAFLLLLSPPLLLGCWIHPLGVCVVPCWTPAHPTHLVL